MTNVSAKNYRKARRVLRYTPGDEVAVLYAQDVKVRYVRATLDDVTEKDRRVELELTPDEARHLAAKLLHRADQAEAADNRDREARRSH